MPITAEIACTCLKVAQAAAYRQCRLYIWYSMAYGSASTCTLDIQKSPNEMEGLSMTEASFFHIKSEENSSVAKIHRRLLPIIAVRERIWGCRAL